MRLLGFTCIVILFAATMIAQSNPVPLINNPLVPPSAIPGRQSLKIIVNGVGFVGGSVVNWNRVPLATAFVSSSQLVVTVPAADFAAAGTASVTVFNPPPGGGSSNVNIFDIRQPYAAVSLGMSALFSLSSAVMNVVGDFNGDGKLDVVFVLNGQQVGVCLGNGDGTFQAPLSTGFSLLSPDFLLAADFNQDGKLDLLLNGYDPITDYASVSVLLGNGDGTFQPAANTVVSNVAGIGTVTVGDFNGDGKLDIATGLSSPEAQVAVLRGNGDGTFAAANFYDLGSGDTAGLVTGDFNLDGKLDLVVGVIDDSENSSISVLLGNGDGTFQFGATDPVPPTPYYIVAGDFNRDGKPDVAFAAVSEVITALGNGDGTFDMITTPSPASPSSPIYAVDMNGDGNLDLVTSMPFHPPSAGVFTGNGDGTFNPNLYSFTHAILTELAPGDFNGDGRLDLLGIGGPILGGASSLFFLPQISSVLSTGFIDFGTVKFGSQATAVVTLSNIGVAPLIIYGTKIDSKFQVFRETNNCGSSLDAGTRCTLKITFKPLKPGNSHDGLHGIFKLFDSSVTGPQEIAITGYATSP